MAENHEGLDRQIQNPAKVEHQGLQFAQATGDDFGKMMRGINEAAEGRAQHRLTQNEFVPPTGESTSPSERAGSLTRELVEKTKFGMNLNRDDGMSYNPDSVGKPYLDRVKSATADVDRKEHDIAQQQWDKLDPSKKQAIIGEQESLQYQMLQQNSQKRTPNLDAFRDDLSKGISPLETQRDQIHHDVFNHLSNDEKLAIYRRQENKKSFKAL